MLLEFWMVVVGGWNACSTVVICKIGAIESSKSRSIVFEEHDRVTTVLQTIISHCSKPVATDFFFWVVTKILDWGLV